MVFTDALTQWDIIAGFGGGGRTRLIYSEAKVIAEAHGFEWNGDLLDRLRVCEGWLLHHDREEAERTKKNDELRKLGLEGRPEAVN